MSLMKTLRKVYSAAALCEVLADIADARRCSAAADASIDFSTRAWSPLLAPTHFLGHRTDCLVVEGRLDKRRCKRGCIVHGSAAHHAASVADSIAAANNANICPASV